jgi:hypothetical protein
MMNKRDHKPYQEYYDQETLEIVNLFMKEDFEKLDYLMINDVGELKKISSEKESDMECEK